MRKYKVIAVLAALVLCLALAGGALAMSSSSYQLTWDVVSGGSRINDSPSFRLGYSAGQPVIGASGSTSYRLGSGYWYGVAGLPPPPIPGLLPGDATVDGVVNGDDLNLVLQSFNTHSGNPGFNPAADLNGDGFIDIFDIVLVGINFGNTL
ncbi:dockerin type I domain-containing protein [Chloroflexota bacterium]